MSKNILFIHAEKAFKTGAHYVNETLIDSLEFYGYTVDRVYPEKSINLLSKDLAGIANILFFHSLINKWDNSQYNLIQGTTYTTLAFLGWGTPVISHFGSTTWWFLKAVPSFTRLAKESPELVTILRELYDIRAISANNTPLKPLRDISGIEIYVAKKSDAVIATSEKVRKELIKNKIPKDQIYLIHNAIEQYWFDRTGSSEVKNKASLVYLGRIGNDDFTVKLKGLLHLIYVFKDFPDQKKVIIGMCHNAREYGAYFKSIPYTETFLNVPKENIPEILQKHYGDIYINASQYEWFCLSLVEAMSQGLIPIVFAFWVASEIIRDGENGYIVNNTKEMMQRITEITNDPLRRKQMAESAIKTTQQFHPTEIIAQYIKMYGSIIKKDIDSKSPRVVLKRKKGVIVPSVWFLHTVN